MRTKFTVVSTLSLLAFAEGGRLPYGYAGSEIDTSIPIRDIPVDIVDNVRERESRPSNLQALVQAAESVGFKPDMETIKPNLIAFLKKAGGEAVAAVDYEARRLGPIISNKIDEGADAVVKFAEDDKKGQEQFRKFLNDKYGALNFKDARAVSKEVISEVIGSIPDENLNIVAKSLVKSANEALDMNTKGRPIETVPLAAGLKKVEDLRQQVYLKNQMEVAARHQLLQEKLDANLELTMNGLVLTAVAPLASQWKKKCRSMPSAKKSRCMAKFQKATGAIAKQQVKSVKAAAKYLMDFENRLLEATKPSAMP